MLGRGTADDKGQIHAHSWPRRRCSRRAAACPINVKYVFEGEEESGSRAPRARGSAEQATGSAADAAIISDTGFFEGNIPAITVGLRGHDVRADRRRRLADRPPLRAATAERSSNPAIALAQIIAALKGPDGRIRIPGFYDDVRGR